MYFKKLAWLELANSILYNMGDATFIFFYKRSLHLKMNVDLFL